MNGIIILILMAVAWAALIVPQQRRMRRQRELVASIEVGDDVMTTSGIYGTISGQDDDDMFLTIAEGVEVRIARGAISAKVEFESETSGDGVEFESETSGDGVEFESETSEDGVEFDDEAPSLDADDAPDEGTTH